MADSFGGQRPTRRDLFSGRAIRHVIERGQEELAKAAGADDHEMTVESADTIRLAARAMACEFSVILNPSENRRQVISASDALEVIHELENRLTIYRDQSELLDINTAARTGFASLNTDLLEFLKLSLQIATDTKGAFTPAGLPLNLLWRSSRREGKVPDQQAIATALSFSNYEDVQLDVENSQVSFQSENMGFDLSGIGKGYALDQVCDHLNQEEVTDYLVHGGHSSVVAHGRHHHFEGWPIGIRHPLFPQMRIATLILKEHAFSASGSGTQFFRHDGKRYGHIIDPRSGWPVDHLLSVVVTAPNAALADALSTAFYVLPIDETLAYCEQHREIGVLIFPQAVGRKKLEPISMGIAERDLIWER